MPTPASSDRSAWLRWSLRTLLTITMLAASYFAGWVSHREWNKRNVEEVILNATDRIGGPVIVEAPPYAPDVHILRGPKGDVEEMKEAVQDIDAAARK